VHEVKFTRWRRLGMDLGRLLGAAVGDEMDRLGSSGLDAGMAGVLDRAPVVVPMPTTLGRLLVRGIDHAKAIARGVAAEVGGELAQPLRRLRRPSQTEVAPSERGANVSRAVVAKRKDACRGLDRRLVVLVDDVTTTGATLRTACRALREGGLSLDRSLVWVAIVGVAGERERGESSAGVSDRPRA
jgi:predicted amidophosphoribosyltransferase